MTNCTESLERLPLFVGGELDALDAALVTSHLSQCDSCSREEKALQASRELFTSTVQAPKGALSDLDLWSGIRASMIDEGLLDAPGIEQNNWELRPVASAAPQLSLLRKVASVAAAAAVIGFASLAGSGLLGTGSGPLDGSGGDGPMAFGPMGHVAPVAAALELSAGESAMRPLGPGEGSLSTYSRTLKPLLKPTGLQNNFPVDPRNTSASSLANHQSEQRIELR